MSHHNIFKFLLNITALLLSSCQALMIDVVVKGHAPGESQRLRLCKPFTKDAYEGVRAVSPATHKHCPDGTPIWYWDFGSLETSEVRVGNEYHTLIQITGGPDTETDPGITNGLQARDYLFYSTLKRGRIYRSLFKVRRGDRYLYIGEEDDLRAGDILEFWGPSEPEYRKLYLTMFGPGAFGLRRIPYSEDPDVSPEVELRVRVASSSNTKNGVRSERERFSTGSPVHRSTSLSLQKQRKPKCFGSICKAAAKGLGSLYSSAKRLLSTGNPSSIPEGAGLQDLGNILDDPIAFADRSGTGRVRLRDSSSRPQTQNTDPSASARRQSNRERVPEALGPADEEGVLAPLPRILNLGPLGLTRILQSDIEANLPKITEETKVIDTHAEIRTPLEFGGTHPNSMTNSRPDTHGHFGSVVLLSPKELEIAENPEEEDEGDKEDDGDYKPEEEEDTSSLSITLSGDVNGDDDIVFTNPPVVVTREGGPGARKSVLDLSRATSTHGSQLVPATDKQLRRSKQLTESDTEEFEI
ncbi:hypothetical protein TWF730_008458 [Orbilia blumenaviensis]|uniref:Uncharacterized protein n=1 Tax=Orbilia blumenaviensis TaxID=1796055 RepID=A0AAV9V415_9PEZI